MGLFKFIKRLFGKSELPVKDSKQSDKLTAEPSTVASKPKGQAYQKRVLRRPDRLTWQMYKGEPSRETDIVIGFDFGTACTKVIIQDGILKKAYAVPLNGTGREGNRYLLPTVIGVTDDGEINLGNEGTLIDSLKIKFLHSPTRPITLKNNAVLTAAEATSAYVGLVLRKIRDWFWKEKRSDYQGAKIDWLLNIGMSSRSYDDKTLKEQMELVALAGWNLTLKRVDTINIREVKIAMASAERQLSEGTFDEEAQQLHPDNVCSIPEIIAQVVGYARSPMRQDGMYLIVDVGASTIDVSNFIIHEGEGEDIYTILVAEVEKLGTSILHNYKVSCAEAIIREHAGDTKAIKFVQNTLKASRLVHHGITPLPDIEKFFPNLPHEAMRDYRRKNLEFMIACSRLVRKTIKESMFRRNPYSSAWKNGLPVFLCGGGSQIGTYKDIIPHAEKQLSRTAFSRFNKKQIPRPVNLETADIPPRDYHRMSVAYGLSFSADNIGEIISLNSFDDLVVKDRIRTIIDYYIDKDMV